MSISYKLDHFEGPLDLLLHLIEKNKVSIYDIPIVTITQQYLEYVSRMESEDLNVVSEFLVMAATLIDIKCRMLLPVPETEEEEQEDPRAELAARLLEYKTYKYMAAILQEMEQDAQRHLYKAPTVPRSVARYEPPVDLDEVLGGLTLAKLQRIFDSVMKRQEERVDPIRSKFGKISREAVSLEQTIGSVLEYARRERRFRFRQMLSGRRDRVEVVVTFLAVLELMKLGRIRLTQEELFDDMEIEAVGPDGELGELDLEGLEDFRS